ncbi:MAG: hypothetical protein IT233_06920 [Bacteroidia bacterium]|nr:hypothetical protein [Bacteroidia bacterium]
MKLITRSLFFLFLFSQSTLFSQTIPVDWVVTYNGQADNTDQVADMTIDAAGNAYVTGTSLGSQGNLDIVTVKYDINGTQVWARTFNGSGNDNDGAADLWLDASGNLYVTGKEKGSSNFENLVVIKYDNAGNQLWAQTYNGSSNLQDEGKNVETDASGNVYVCGYTTVAGPYMDWLVIKYNSSGTQQWVITYNGSNNGNDDATDLVVDAAGNPVVTGSANDINGTLSDIVTKKLSSSNGSTLWTNTYNGTANDNDFGKLITQDKNGNIFVAGRSFVSGYWFDYITLRLNASTGVQMWATGYGYTDVNTNVKYEEVNGLIADSLGNVYITGQSQGNGNQTALNDIATIKYNSAGVQQWVMRYAGSGNVDDRGADIALDDTLNVYITGYKSINSTNRDMITIKYNSAGTQMWLVTHDALGNGMDESKAVEVLDDGSVYIAGSGDVDPSTSVVNEDYHVIKYSPQNTSVWESDGIVFSTIVYPNPAADHFNVTLSFHHSLHTACTLKLYDLSGRLAFSAPMENRNGEVTLRVRSSVLSPGLYHGLIFSATSEKLGSFKVAVH